MINNSREHSHIHEQQRRGLIAVGGQTHIAQDDRLYAVRSPHGRASAPTNQVHGNFMGHEWRYVRQASP